MESREIEQRIATILGDAEVEVLGEDCDFTVTVISDEFNQLMPVRRQQLVLSGFTDVLASGALHALTVKAFTVEEWNQKYSNLVQISL